MILIDDRVGSKELLAHFKPFGCEVDICRLVYADVCFVGQSEEGPIYIGIERKVIGDLVNSLRSDRLSGHQLEGLLENFKVVYLVVEGIYKPGDSGELVTAVHGGWRPFYVGRTPMLYKEVDNFLTSMEMAGLRVRRTGSIQETAAVIADLESWWTKDWTDHKAHKGIYAPVPENPNSNGRLSFLVREKPNLVTAMAAQIQGIDQRAWQVGKFFKNPLEMCQATEKEWQKIPGIGKKGSKQIVQSLRGEA